MCGGEHDVNVMRVDFTGVGQGGSFEEIGSYIHVKRLFLASFRHFVVF